MDASCHGFGVVTCNSPHRIILDISAGTFHTVPVLKSVYHVLTSLQLINRFFLITKKSGVSWGLLMQERFLSSGIEDEKPLQERCGIVAIFGPPSLNQVPLALRAGLGVQHRGQNGAGMTLQTENGITRYTGEGLLRDIFTPKVVEKKLSRASRITLLHTRYGTSGDYRSDNIQPCMVRASDGTDVVVIHNGEFANSEAMRERVMGPTPEGVSDTYLFTQLLAQATGNSWEEKLVRTLESVKGAYSLAIQIGPQLFLARDEFGLRPLMLGRTSDGWIAASETHALDKVNVRPVREIKKNEIARIDEQGLHTIREGVDGSGLCAFELAYFSRPDSLKPTYDEESGIAEDPRNWRTISSFRHRCGEILAQEAPINNATFVVGVPDSGVAVGTSYAEASGVPYVQAILRDHFDTNGDKRLFMTDNDINAIGSKVLGKLSILNDSEMWEDAIVVIGDDSIVRGNVSRKIVEIIRSLGAKAVHWVIGFPAVAHRCHLGVSMRTEEELIAARHHSDPVAIAQEIGADSVHYISHEGFIRASNRSGSVVIPRNPQEIFLANNLCGGCVTGIYPVDREGNIFQYAR